MRDINEFKDPSYPPIRFHRQVHHVALLFAGVLLLCNLRSLLLQIRSVPVHLGPTTKGQHDDLLKSFQYLCSPRIHSVVWLSIQK